MSSEGARKLIVFCIALGVSIGITATTGFAGPKEGKAIFEKQNCGKCHQTQGPAKEKTFEDQMKKKGPELWYAGDKFRKEWLEEWLANPTIIRHLKYNSITEKSKGGHPSLSNAQAKDVAAYLLTLKSGAVKEGVVKEKSSPRAKLNFKKKYGCIGCHTIKKGKKKKIGGVTGPDLSEAGKRLKGDWVYMYLKKPKLFKPIKRMPVFAGIINDAEMKALAGFVASQGRKKK